MESRSEFPHGPFVSRENELQKLEGYFSSVLESKNPRIVFVHGDFGVGKTTLVETFLQLAERGHQNVLIGRGKCSLENQENGRVPFVQVLTSLLGQQKQGLRGKKLLNWAKDVIPGWLDFATLGLMSPIVTTIDKSIELFKGAETSKTVFGESQIFMQFANAINELSQNRGVILFIDDLQWADESSLRMIFHLMNNLENCAVMIVCTYRTYDIQNSPHSSTFNEIHHNLLYKSKAFKDIELKEGINVFLYASKRYGINTIPANILRAIQQNSDGLPMYVDQLFFIWEDNQLLRLKEQSRNEEPVWELATNVDLIIPEGITELLKLRIGLLNAGLKNIITGASVEGEDFSAQTIEKLFAVDRLLLFDELSTLERKFNLIKERGSERISTVLFDFYRFAHRFIREYVYDNEIPDGKKREMHQRIGECLEAICNDPIPVAAQIARHFKEAEQPERAVEYMLMAAQYEASRFSWAECQNWCLQGLSIIDTFRNDRSKLKIEFLEQLSDSFHCTGNYEKAADALSLAIEIAETSHIEAEKLLHLYASISDTFEQMEDYENDQKIINKGKLLIRTHKIPLCEPRVDFSIGEGLLKVRQGQLNTAITILKKSVTDAKRIKQDIAGKKLLAGALNCLGVAYSFKGDYKNSVKLYRKAADLVGSTGDTNLQAYYMVNMIDDSYWITGNSPDLQSSISEAKKLVYQIGDIDSESYLLSVEGNIYLRDQKYELAENSLKKAINIWHRLSIEKISSYAYSDLASVYLGKGDINQALAYALKAVELASHDTVRGYGLDVLGTIEFQKGDMKNSIRHLQEAIRILKDDDSLHFAARAQRHYAEALFKMGKEKQAARVLSEALTTFHDLGLRKEETITRGVMKEIQAI